MSRNVAIRTDEQRHQYRGFLLRHCGNPLRSLTSCGLHPPIFEMTHAELRQAALDELGFAPSRQYVYLQTRRLGIRSVRHGGHAPIGRPLTGLERYQRFRERVRQDPVAEAAFRQRRRASDSKRRQTPKYRKYNAERMKRYREERAQREPAMAGSPS